MPKWDNACHFRRTFVSSLIFLECFEIEICSVPVCNVARPSRSFLRRAFLVSLSQIKQHKEVNVMFF
jgi:hypothetical protein